MFSISLKRKAGVFNFLRFEERVPEKLRFRERLMWTEGLTWKIKFRFQIPLMAQYRRGINQQKKRFACALYMPVHFLHDFWVTATN